MPSLMNSRVTRLPIFKETIRTSSKSSNPHATVTKKYSNCAVGVENNYFRAPLCDVSGNYIVCRVCFGKKSLSKYKKSF